MRKIETWLLLAQIWTLVGLGRSLHRHDWEMAVLFGLIALALTVHFFKLHKFVKTTTDRLSEMNVRYWNQGAIRLPHEPL